MPKGFLQIDILGTSFSIQSDEDSIYLEKLLSQYRRMVTQIEGGVSLKDPLKTAILAGIMLCDELQKEKKNSITAQRAGFSQSELHEAERLTLRMIEKIDKALE